MCALLLHSLQLILLVTSNSMFLGGTLAGAVYRMNMGLRGMFVGSILGAVMGTLSGSLQYLNHMHINKGREIKSAENRRHLFYLKHLDILK